MKLPRLCTALLLTAAAAAQALAHGFWIEPRYGRLEATFGHGPAVEAYPTQSLTGAWAYAPDGSPIRVDIQRLDTHALLIPRDNAAAVVAATLDSKFFRPERETNESPNLKYGVIVLREGACFDTIKEIRLVLVPEVDPLKVGVGNPLPLRAFVDGKPAAGIRLMSDYRNIGTVALGTADNAVTDAEGRASIIVRNPGLNVIAGFIAVTDEAGVRSSLHSSLSFLGQPYEHN